MRWRLFACLAAIALGLKAQGNDSQVRPPVTPADVEVVKRARKILNSPAVWNRADTRECPPTEKTFSLYCALEKATDEVTGNFAHRGAAMQEARFVIDDITHNKDYDHRLMGYNNDPTTTFADIQHVFDLLEARIVQRLKDPAAAPPVRGAPAPRTPESAAAPAAPKPVTAADLDTLKRARALLSSEARWDRADTQKCPAGAPTISLFCAFQKAAIDATGKFDNDGAAIEEARSLISELDPNREKYHARLMDYNNDPAVSFSDIQKLFRQVEERLTKKMAGARQP
jgi:hypothetical protein